MTIGPGMRDVRTPAWAWAAFLGLVAFYQLLLYGNGGIRLFAPELLDRTFDSMLQHLLRGEVGVDPDAIGYEAFTAKDGRTTSYFGIVPALLRLPALLLASDPERMHLARLSCVLAATAYVGLVVGMVVTAHRSLTDAARNPLLLGIVVVAVAWGGAPLIVANAAYVYNEPVLWGAVTVAAFNLIIVRAALSERALSGAELYGAALVAGLALNTRPSAGVGLTIALGLILGWYGLARLRGRAAPGWAALVAAGLVLAVGVAATGLVNFARWGNPLVYVDFTRHQIMHRYPERLENLLQNGSVNVSRIPLSISYYLAGVPYIFKYHATWGPSLQAFYDVIEGPPSSPAVTGPLWTALAVLGIGPALRRGTIIACLLGQAMAGCAVLAAMALALRYRMDFAGLVALPAVFGYVAASNWLAARSRSTRLRAMAAAVVLAGVGLASSHYILLMSKVLTPAVPVEVRCALQRAAPFVPVNMAPARPPGCRGTS